MLWKRNLDLDTNSRADAKHVRKEDMAKNIWPNTRGGRWRPSWNNELYSLYNDPNIVEDIKIRRLGWEGHIIRMVEERIPKKVLNGNFPITRPVGRPRTRWADVVQRDALRLLGIRGWRGPAENRDEWRASYEGGQGPEWAVAS
jgi:hypothetical protein